MHLYHFSEEPDIRRFVPRPPLAHPEQEPLVWAMDEWHQPMYFTPRDCPRVCFWPLPTTTPQDRDRFWSGVGDGTRMVVAIEWSWYDRLRAATLYRYTLPEAPFVSLHDAGMYVSREPVEPLAVEPMTDLPAQLRAASIELRLCPTLVPLGKAIIQSSLHFSLIRMRNAAGWPDDKATR